MSIRICILKNNGTSSNGFEKGLNEASDLDYLGAYATVEEVLREKPDVVLADVHSPSANAFDRVAGLKARAPQLPVLMLVEDEKNGKDDIVDWTFSSFHAGANGCLLKSMPINKLAKVINQVCKETNRGRRVILMTTESDHKLGKAVRHLPKLAEQINAPSMIIRRGLNWQTITMIGKAATL